MQKETPTDRDRSESGGSSPLPDRHTLPSSAERRITTLVHEFVLEVFLRRGEFWDAVRDLRVRWNVSAETRLPPINHDGIYLPPGNDRSVKPAKSNGTGGATPVALRRWREDLDTLHDRFVPTGCRTSARDDSTSRRNWARCLSACLLYDPPQAQLLKYADLITPSLIGLCPRCKGVGQVPRGSSVKPKDLFKAFSEMPFMVAPPIEYLRDPEVVEKATEAHWREVIDELAVRLEPQGLDIKAMVGDILQDRRIQAEKKKRADKNLPKPYIVVDKFTTGDDVSYARSMIADVHGWNSKGGASKRDRLTTVECAILCDRHGYKLAEVAKHYGWSRDTARIYRNLGREILSAEKICNEITPRGFLYLQPYNPNDYACSSDERRSPHLASSTATGG